MSEIAQNTVLSIAEQQKQLREQLKALKQQEQAEKDQRKARRAERKEQEAQEKAAKLQARSEKKNARLQREAEAKAARQQARQERDQKLQEAKNALESVAKARKAEIAGRRETVRKHLIKHYTGKDFTVNDLRKSLGVVLSGWEKKGIAVNAELSVCLRAIGAQIVGQSPTKGRPLNLWKFEQQQDQENNNEVTE